MAIMYHKYKNLTITLIVLSSQHTLQHNNYSLGIILIEKRLKSLQPYSLLPGLIATEQLYS